MNLLKTHFQKFHIFSKLALKLPQDISYDWERQNCDWVLFLALYFKFPGHSSYS